MPKGSPQPIFETSRLVFRTWRGSDAEAYVELYREPEMFRWLGDGKGTPPTDLDRVRRRLREAEDHGASPLGLWATVEKESGRIIGNCGLLETAESGGTEVVYHIGKPDWGRGFATEASRGCVEYGLGPLGLPRLVALVYPQNLASVRVLEKIGMRRVGERAAHGASLLLYEITA
jgi:[ribosomal protein S5]-alanine N-acetyltransferase